MNRYESERLRSVHLSIVAVLTLCNIAVVVPALTYEWRENWMLPLLLAAVAACWVIHIRQAFSEQARLWFFAAVTWALILFEGMHPNALLDFSVLASLEFAMFSQADERRILHISLGLYVFMLSYHVWLILTGAGVSTDALVIRQLAVHVVCAVIFYILGLRIIDKREADRVSDERIITELDGTRRRTENFMANVSHELRTPVNVVTGLSAVMGERLQNDRDRRDAALILEAGRRLSDQVDDILDYTEIETGKLAVTEEHYTIAAVMNDVITALQIDARTDLPQIIIDVDAEIPRILSGDARRIKKVLMHLVDNAIKFTKRGGVYINLYRMPQPYGINLCMDVRDTGIGMGAEALEKLREGIYQADAERNRENTGFGLGLQIVYGIVHVMGGFVRIESEEGAGTRVHVSVPQKVVNAGRCMEVEDPGRLRLAFFQRADKFDTPAVRAFYFRMIGHVIDSFGLTLQRVTTLEDVRKMMEADTFTHLFLADEEYSEDPAYFDALAKEIHVIVVAKNTFRPTPFSRVTILKKPLYAFPLVEVLNAPDEQSAKEALYGEEDVRFEGLKALAVDDEEMNLVVARGIFAGYGMETDTASSGQEAIEKVRENDYHVIFMDHMMPVMAGVECAHHIRDLLQTTGRRCVIIALTANAVSGAREMFMREGFDGFIAKPIERQELERVLKNALLGKGGVSSNDASR